MEILVCIKQVPDTTEIRIDPETNTLIRTGVPSIMNPFDAYAVEQALQLKEMTDGRVLPQSVNPPMQRFSLAMIRMRAIHLKHLMIPFALLQSVLELI